MNNYQEFLSGALRESGEVILRSFGSVLATTQKADPSQVVTEVDIASEKLITERIKKEFPDHSIIAEESGFIDNNSEYTWIVDPIDGTSNFAQGLPWFGVMIALLNNYQPIASGIYLPVTDELYTAEKGKGLLRNGKRITYPGDKPLKESLISFCTDATTDEEHKQYLAGIFTRLLPEVRNLRSTNSAVDLSYVAEGKLGGMLVFKSKIWDVAPVALLASESGQVITDDFGEELDFRVDEKSYTRNYTFVIARPHIHNTLLLILAKARNSS